MKSLSWQKVVSRIFPSTQFRNSNGMCSQYWQQHCHECHGEDVRESDLDLRTVIRHVAREAKVVQSSRAATQSSVTCWTRSSKATCLRTMLHPLSVNQVADHPPLDRSRRSSRRSNPANEHLSFDFGYRAPVLGIPKQSFVLKSSKQVANSDRVRTPIDCVHPCKA